MAEGSISPTAHNSNEGASRVNARQAEQGTIRKAEVAARERAASESRVQASAENQLGRNIDLKA